MLSGPKRTLRVSASVPNLDPAAVFAHWTDPEKLVRWWPPKARVDLRKGGEFCFRWPEQDWTLCGTYENIQPERLLAFTWRWEHLPSVTKHVMVRFSPRKAGGTAIELEHGPYRTSVQDSELRNSHVEGWRYFLGRLSELSS